MLKERRVHLRGAARPVDCVVDAIAACGTDAAMLQHRLENPRGAGRSSGALGRDLHLDGEGPPNVGVALEDIPTGIMSDLVEEHYRLAWAGTEPWTMLRRRTTLADANQLQRAPTRSPIAVIDSWTDATAR